MSLQDKLRAGREAVRAGVSVAIVPDLFQTPDSVACRVVDYLDLYTNCRVLEPSAGTGALVRAIESLEPTASLTIVERDDALATRLASTVSCRVSNLDIYAADFLGMDPAKHAPFPRIAMNPPFSKGADIKHVMHAIKFLEPGGVLVAIVADGPRQARAFAEFEDLERLPSGTFAGTGVCSRIIRWQA